MSSNADAREARAVAEEAREKEWTLPSFGKSLFLGDMRLDLIYPQPKAPAAEVARSEEFLATLRITCRRTSIPMSSSETAGYRTW